MKSSCLSFLQSHQFALAFFGLLSLTACGGGSPGPSSPSPSGAVVLNGSVVGASSVSASSAYAATATSTRSLAGGSIVVSIAENPSLTTQVGVDGSFTLRGLPTGSFSLVFSREGIRIGTLTFNSVLPSQEVNITVSITGSSLTLLEEQRNGIGHGDLEIEGRVETILFVSETADSRFIIDGRTVVARPGQTTIRKGNALRRPADLTVGISVHVKGNWLPAEGSTQPVLASEIKIQEDDDEHDPAPSPSPTPRPACMIEGGVAGRGIELEGRVSSGNAAAFQLSIDGDRASGPVNILAAGASLECTPRSGPNAPTPAECSASLKAGAKVHVSGTLDACTATSAQVSASKVQVQK